MECLFNQQWEKWIKSKLIISNNYRYWFDKVIDNKRKKNKGGRVIFFRIIKYYKYWQEIMKLFINQCRYQDLFILFGVGRRVVDRIWEILIIKGFIVEDDLVIIFYFRIIRVLLDFIDFFFLFDEIMNENFGCDKGGGGVSIDLYQYFGIIFLGVRECVVV